MSQQKKRLRAAVGCLIVVGVLWTSASAKAQNPQPLVDENAVQKISDHVYAIIGFPNIGIVVGNRATLVVDTGLGERNGASAMRAVQKLAKGPILYLTTTHFHPEHSSGEAGFSPNTVLIRPKIQQEDLDNDGGKVIDTFRNMSAQNKMLLQDVHLRQPDILFDGEMKVDLGGVTARLFWAGPAHTRGDQVIYVEEDRTLIPGDIVQDKLIPNFYGDASSPKGWIAALDKVASLDPRFIVPDHGALGDGSLIANERAFIVTLRTRALELKRQGKSPDAAVQILTPEIKTKYPDWTGNALGNDIKRIYAEGE
jgi:glyoxylase-like metal-dependent hydrolase (beta-lactamase superfamily II)